MSSTGDFLGIGIAIGVFVGCCLTCLCCCFGWETRTIEKIVLDWLTARASKSALQSEYGVLSKGDLFYVRGLNLSQRPYVRYQPEVRPSDGAIKFHAMARNYFFPAMKDMGERPETLLPQSRPHEARNRQREIDTIQKNPHNNLEFDENNNCWLRFPGARDDRFVVWVHGGAYLAASSAGPLQPLEKIAKATGYTAFSIEYPLAPDATIEEMVDVVSQQIEENIVRKHPNSKFILVGDSAGGGVVVQMLLKHAETKAGSRPFQPDCVILFSPWLNLACDTDSYRQNNEIDWVSAEWAAACSDYIVQNRGVDGEWNGQGAPIPSGIPRGNWSEMPPTYIVSGGIEIYFDDAKEVAERLAENGRDLVWDIEPMMYHDFVIPPVSDEAIAVITRAANWATQKLDSEYVPIM